LTVKIITQARDRRDNVEQKWFVRDMHRNSKSSHITLSHEK